MMLTRRLRAGYALAAAVLVCPLTAWAQAPQTRWYLAEGATGGFQEDIVIANPGSAPASVTLSILSDSNSPPMPVPLTIAPTSRQRVRLNDIPGLAQASVSAIVDSNVPVVVERTMYWGGPSLTGGHNAAAVEAAAPTWYLAEGAASDFFQCFILLANPQATPQTVNVRLQREDGFVKNVPVEVGALDRETLYVNQDPRTPEFQFSSFSAVVTAPQPIIVERAMYFKGFQGGHSATGVTQTSTAWTFAEGFTGGDFSTFFLLNNPDPAATANVTLTFYFDDGTPPRPEMVQVGPSSRQTVYVNQYPGMTEKSFATRVTSDVAIVAERAMYWGGFSEGHATAGVTQEFSQWGFAEGLAHSNFGTSFDTFFLFVNSSPNPLTVHGYFYREDGTGTARVIEIAPNSRHTLYAGSVPGMSNQKFAAFFQGSGPFLVERAVYWGAGWYGGHVSTGVPFTGALAPPGPLPFPTTTSLSPANGPTAGGTNVVIRGTNYAQGAAVFFGGIPAPAVQVIDATTIIATSPARGPGAVAVEVHNAGVSMVLGGAFVYNSPGPAPPPLPPPPPADTPTDAPIARWPQPLPSFEHVVNQVAAERPGDLRFSCPTEHRGENNNFMIEVVRRLRQQSARWGFNWKRGNVGDLSQDIVTYFYGEGSAEGSTQVYIVDIIGGHCGPNPSSFWQDQTQATISAGTIGRWTLAPLR